MSNSDLLSPSVAQGSLATGSLRQGSQGAKVATAEQAEWEPEWQRDEGANNLKSSQQHGVSATHHDPWLAGSRWVNVWNMIRLYQTV
jgi:hypothetical protein